MAGFYCDKSMTHNGFRITFENGWTVSVQFGKYNYCAKRVSKPRQAIDPSKPCPNAEIAVFKGDTWRTFDGDQVKGYVEPAELLAVMNEVAAL